MNNRMSSTWTRRDALRRLSAASCAGLFGLGAFVFLLYRLLRDTLLGWHASLVESSFSEAFMKILHVCLIMFLVDQIKIEYIRNNIYVFFIWLFFGLTEFLQSLLLFKSF